LSLAPHKTLIVIPVYGAWDYLVKAFESIAKYTPVELYSIVLIYNPNPEDSDITRIADCPSIEFAILSLCSRLLPVNDIDVHVLPQRENQGVSKSWNIGIREGLAYKNAYYDSFLFYNTDVVVFDQWLTSLREVMFASRPKPYCVQPILTEDGEPQPENILSKIKNRKPILELAPGLNGPCFMLSRECVQDIGLFDENYRYGFYEDTDYLMRIREFGQQPVTAMQAYVHHYHAKSRSGMKDWESIQRNNKRYFEKKWSVFLPGSLDCKTFPDIERLRVECGYSY